MASHHMSRRSNFLIGNNENSYKATKEVAKIVSGPTLRRAVLGDRTNNLKNTASELQTGKAKQDFKKPPAVCKEKVQTKKTKLVKQSSTTTKQKEELVAPSCISKKKETAAKDSSMVSVNGSVMETSKADASVAPSVPQDESAMSVQEKTTNNLNSVTDLDIEELTESFSNKLLTVIDIDSEDADNPQLVSQYANKIYAYLRSLEFKFPVKKHYLEGCVVSPRMRSILVDWLVQVHMRFNLLQETLFLTICILDRYLQAHPNTPKEELQLVGISAMFVASKYEEMFCVEIQDFVFITDKAYSKKQIRHMEIKILKTLDYYVSFPLPLHFLRRNSKAGQVDGSQHTLAKYLIELCLPEYSMCHYKASEIGAAALSLTLRMLGEEQVWNDTLAFYSGYSEAHLLPIVCKMAQCVTRSHTSKHKAIQQKYQNNKFMKISELPQLKGSVIRSLSEKAATYS